MKNENEKTELIVGADIYRFDSSVFSPPFRLGRKQKRAILDSKGIEVIIMAKHSEVQAQMYCDYLNGIDSPLFIPNYKGDMINEEQIKELGWKLVKQYSHDQFNTNRYKLGCMEIEFTYDGKELLTHHITITDVNCMPLSFNQAKLLTQLLGNWSK